MRSIHLEKPERDVALKPLYDSHILTEHIPPPRDVLSAKCCEFLGNCSSIEIIERNPFIGAIRADWFDNDVE